MISEKTMSIAKNLPFKLLRIIFVAYTKHKQEKTNKLKAPDISKYIEIAFEGNSIEDIAKQKLTKLMRIDAKVFFQMLFNEVIICD